MRGGARWPHARRSLSTCLSVAARSGAATKQMGLVQHPARVAVVTAGPPVHVAAHVEGRRCAGGRGLSRARDQHAASAVGRRAPIAKSGGVERRPGRGRPSTTSATRTRWRACARGSGFAGRGSRRGRSGRRDARSASPRPRGAARTASWCGPRCASPSICSTEAAPRSPPWRRRAAGWVSRTRSISRTFTAPSKSTRRRRALSHALARRIERDVLPRARCSSRRAARASRPRMPTGTG